MLLGVLPKQRSRTNLVVSLPGADTFPVSKKQEVAMMGRQATKREYFVSVSLDEYVPEDHLLRAVDHYLDLSEFRQHVGAFYSHTGRPSIDPELIIRMLIIGYCYGIGR
jgi:hypothetical protein